MNSSVTDDTVPDGLHWLARGLTHLPADASWLGPWEAGRLARMRYPKRRSEFLISRLAAKEAARAVSPVPPPHDRIEVRHLPGGAPELHVGGRRATRSISLTDRADWAVCLLGPHGARIGCDLELVEPRSEGFVADWLTPAEQRIVHAAADAQEWARRANLIWSAKESALKVLRTGLRRDTRSVEVSGIDAESVTGEWAPLEVRPVEGGVFSGWWLSTGAFLLTVAADRPLPPPTALESAPLASAVPTHDWMGQPLVEG